jgi:aspartyl-tRNA synthetase
VQTEYGEAIERLYGKEVIVPTLPFPSISLAELYRELEKRYGYHLPKASAGTQPPKQNS